MTGYDINLKQADLVALFTENNAMAGLLETVINQVLEAKMTEHLGAEHYEHSDGHVGYRNGFRPRHI